MWMWAHERGVGCGRRATKRHRVARKEDTTVEQALQSLRDAMADTRADEGPASLTAPPPSDLSLQSEVTASEDSADQVKDLILRLNSMEQQLGLVDT